MQERERDVRLLRRFVALHRDLPRSLASSTRHFVLAALLPRWEIEVSRT